MWAKLNHGYLPVFIKVGLGDKEKLHFLFYTGELSLRLFLIQPF